ncbi:hypothetical protein KDAU_08330 [Dictyobacter aurantiacus]|uniref:Uncharacterized protein n=2 Tax=Dictyobacter aurantiacus TaxID=1936993 RepID=A0A401Z9F7_9CHLR|nr:hypothetical protein KDAU_08330 [Dictyobacter aurantiacus]
MQPFDTHGAPEQPILSELLAEQAIQGNPEALRSLFARESPSGVETAAQDPSRRRLTSPGGSSYELATYPNQAAFVEGPGTYQHYKTENQTLRPETEQLKSKAQVSDLLTGKYKQGKGWVATDGRPVYQPAADRNEAARKAKETPGVEGRSAATRKGKETLGPEGRSAAARKAKETLGPEGRSAATRKAKETLGPEGRSAATRKAKETLGPEGRSAATRKAKETRRRRAAAQED